MNSLLRRDLEDLPAHLAEAVIAVEVSRNYRRDDVHAVARRLASAFEYWSPGREKLLYAMIVGHLKSGGCKPAETLIKSRQRVRLRREGDTNVIKLTHDGVHGELQAVVMRASDFGAEERRARHGHYQRITRQPIANDNDPEFEAPFDYRRPKAPVRMVSPGLHSLMRVAGRLASVATQWQLRIRNGVWEGGDDESGIVSKAGRASP